MIDLISSIVGNLSQLAATSQGTQQGVSSLIAGSFGPDFLLSVMQTSAQSLGAAYDASGLSLLPPADSRAGKERAAAIKSAQSDLKLGRLAEARRTAEDLLKQNPNDTTAVYLIGRSYLREGNYQNAELFLARASAITSDNALIEMDLNAARTLRHGLDAALTETKRLLKVNSDATEGLRLANYILDVDPEKLDVYLALADHYERTRKLDLTGAAFVDALNNVPTARQGPLLARLQQFAKAHPDDAGSHDLLARAYAAAGRLSEAEASFNRALELSDGDPLFDTGLKTDFADIYSRAGREALAKGDVATARRHFEKALQLNRDDTRRNELSDLEMSVGEKALRANHLRTALRAFGKAMANMPVFDTEKRSDKLINLYERLAGRFLENGDLEQVVAARNGAYMLDPGNEDRKRGLADAHDTYGLSLFDQGKYREAMRAFKQAVKLFGDDETYAAHLAAAQQAMNS